VKKIGLLFKEASENRIRNNLKNANAVFVVGYSGLSSPDLTALRQSLKSQRANLFVVKNSVARRAFISSGLESIVKGIDGPCGLVFVNDEPVEASKVLCNFLKDHERLRLSGGFVKERILDKKDIEELARLPGKDILRAQAVMLLKSPITSLVFVLNNTIKKFVICLDQIRQKKETKS